MIVKDATSVCIRLSLSMLVTLVSFTTVTMLHAVIGPLVHLSLCVTPSTSHSTERIPPPVAVQEKFATSSRLTVVLEGGLVMFAVSVHKIIVRNYKQFFQHPLGFIIVVGIS